MNKVWRRAIERHVASQLRAFGFGLLRRARAATQAALRTSTATLHSPTHLLPAAGVAVVSLVNAVRLASWMQGGVLVKSQFAALKIAAPAFLAVVALYNYMFAAKKKA